MTLEEHALQIIAQLSTATDYQQADAVLSVLKKDQTVLHKEIFLTLQEKIEQLSPLECNSLQWSMYRYTLMQIRKLAATVPA